MFADPPLFIRLEQRPCSRENCLEKWGWTVGEGTKFTIECNICGESFKMKEGRGQISFLSDEIDPVSLKKALEFSQDIVAENAKLKEEIADLRKQKTPEDAPHRRLIKPLE